MKKLHFLTLFFCMLLIAACNQSKSGALFDGKNANKWQTSGDVSVADSILTLKGKEAKAILKNGKYLNFDLTLEARTVSGGKGSVKFHTDETADKGYSVALNNDRQDSDWWKMTGSLLSVRNITKVLTKENDWFTMHIRVLGKSIQVKVNDVLLVDYIEPAQPYRIEPNTKALLSDGTFALVNESDGEIQFRNISVEIIDPDKAGLDINKQLAEANDEQKDEIIKLHQEDFPVLDYHVHLKGGLTKEEAAKLSRKTGINYAVAPNCGLNFPINTDEQVLNYIDSMRTQPFLLAMQAEGREWLTTFSRDVCNKFDFVFTDAMTFTDYNGHRTRSWIKDEVFIDNEQKYVDMMIDRMCSVLQEPVDIYVNPCYLPDTLNSRYDQLWTEERMNKFIDALVKSGKALEINELRQIPHKAILLKAKEAGVKFTFGSNNVTPNVSDLSYSIKMKKELGLKAKDMYKPNVKL